VLSQPDTLSENFYEDSPTGGFRISSCVPMPTEILKLLPCCATTSFEQVQVNLPM
jgi:hypothetical protein